MAVLLCLPLITPAQITYTTNEQGQISIRTGGFTNLDALMAVLKAELSANAPKSVGNFGATVLDYFTSFNPDLTNVFTSNKGYAYAGVDSIQGGDTSLANSLCIDYKVFGGLALDAITRNGGVSGTIMSQSAGAAFNLPVKDVNVAIFLHGGYDFHAKDTLDLSGAVTKKADRMYGEFGARAMKALGKQTFAGVSLSATLPQKEQIFSAFAGFVF